MDTIASQITSLTTVYSTVYSGADQRKHQNSALLAFVRGIHRGPVHKWPVARKMFSFDDVIMNSRGTIALTTKKCMVTIFPSQVAQKSTWNFRYLLIFLFLIWMMYGLRLSRNSIFQDIVNTWRPKNIHTNFLCVCYYMIILWGFLQFIW